MNRFLIAAFAMMLIPWPTARAQDDVVLRGERIYSEKCASCHGTKGQGTEDHSQSLFGDKPTIDLADVISKTMPEGEPELCIGDDATAVATWMQSAFYSPEAQARINPPRRKLSRLTVSQYRNAVADLVQSFSWSIEPGDQRGLSARYYKSRRIGRKPEIERVDSIVRFDFGEGTPDKEKIPKAKEFSISWNGSLLIDETGWYDFVVKTENGFKLFVNDDSESPLIDAWVKSGYETEYRATRYLLAGRLYPIELQWFTFQEKTASVELLWKTPHGVDQVIPERHLSPKNSPRVLVVDTPFPPDDRSDGYIRGTSVSPEWDEATTFAAIEVADKISSFLREAAKLSKDDSDDERRSKLKDFCASFAFRAFRRPLTESEQQAYIDRPFDSVASNGDAVRRSVLAILKSPRFLYREVTGHHDKFTIAERLSLALIDSIPDLKLIQAAEKGRLKNKKDFRNQAGRLLKSYRGQVRLQEFLRVWLNMERIDEVDKDSDLFKGFSPEVLADMRTSLELLLHDAAAADEGGFQSLMTEPQTWMNGRLRTFYGVNSDNDDGFEFRKTDFEPQQRAGVASHPFLLTALAYQKTSSPIHRGVFLTRGILGRALNPPPDSVTPTAPDLEPHLTTRERVAKQTSPAVCANCHKTINALGFALEEFDAVGRFRKSEKDKPVDASGQFRERSGELTKFRGATELAAFLAKSPETHRSFSRQLFHHMVQQPILAYGPETINELSKFFSNNKMQMKLLMIEIAVRAAAHIDPQVTPPPKEPTP